MYCYLLQFIFFSHNINNLINLYKEKEDAVVAWIQVSHWVFFFVVAIMLAYSHLVNIKIIYCTIVVLQVRTIIALGQKWNVLEGKNVDVTLMFSFMLFVAIYFTQGIMNLIFRKYQLLSNFIVMNVAILLLMLRIMGLENMQKAIMK